MLIDGFFKLIIMGYLGAMSWLHAFTLCVHMIIMVVLMGFFITDYHYVTS